LVMKAIIRYNPTAHILKYSLRLRLGVQSARSWLRHSHASFTHIFCAQNCYAIFYMGAKNVVYHGDMCNRVISVSDEIIGYGKPSVPIFSLGSPG